MIMAIVKDEKRCKCHERCLKARCTPQGSASYRATIATLPKGGNRRDVGYRHELLPSSASLLIAHLGEV